MSKILSGGTKLSQTNGPNFGKSEDLSSFFPKKKTALKARSYRLRDIDIVRLKEVVKRINKVSDGEILSEVSLIKGLLLLGTKTSTDDILKAMKEA